MREKERGGVLSSWERDGFPIDVDIVDADFVPPLSTFARLKDLNKSRDLVSDHKEVRARTSNASLGPQWAITEKFCSCARQRRARSWRSERPTP